MHPKRKKAEKPDHPFTLLGLSDREKFHTGFLAYTINKFGASIAEKVFAGVVASSWQNNPKALVEYNSIDLLLCRCDEYGKEICGTLDGQCMPHRNVIVLAEVKLKTDLHDDQIERYREKYPGKPVLLISLFPTTEGEKTKRFDLCDMQGIIDECLYSADADTKALFSLWGTYLGHLKVVRDYFVSQGHSKIDQEIVKGLRKIKLIGIFQRYRFALVNKDMEKAKSESTKLDDSDKRNIEIKIENTHAESLIEIFCFVKITGGIYKFGVQWQANNLKLFIETKEKNDNNARNVRDGVLQNIAAKVEPENTGLERNGRFRSIFFLEKWIVMEDIKGKGGDLFHLFECALRECRESYKGGGFEYVPEEKKNW